MTQAVTDVKGTMNAFRRFMFDDETGDYGYTGKYKGQACYGLSDPTEVVNCADEKIDFSTNQSENESRKKFAIMDIKEACEKGNLCFSTDEDGVPKEPNEICVKHNACALPGASIRYIPKDIAEFYSEIKDLIFSLKDTKQSSKARKGKTESKEELKKKLVEEMRQIVYDYNTMEYPEYNSNATSDSAGLNVAVDDGKDEGGDEGGDKGSDEGGKEGSKEKGKTDGSSDSETGKPNESCRTKTYKEFQLEINMDNNNSSEESNGSTAGNNNVGQSGGGRPNNYTKGSRNSIQQAASTFQEGLSLSEVSRVENNGARANSGGEPGAQLPGANQPAGKISGTPIGQPTGNTGGETGEYSATGGAKGQGSDDQGVGAVAKSNGVGGNNINSPSNNPSGKPTGNTDVDGGKIDQEGFWEKEKNETGESTDGAEVGEPTETDGGPGGGPGGGSTDDNNGDGGDGTDKEGEDNESGDNEDEEGDGEDEDGAEQKPPVEPEKYKHDQKQLDENISPRDEGIFLSSKEKEAKMEKWFEVWISEAKRDKRRNTGCGSYNFFDREDTINPDDDETTYKEQYIENFLRTLDSKFIYNEEVKEAKKAAEKAAKKKAKAAEKEANAAEKEAKAAEKKAKKAAAKKAKEAKKAKQSDEGSDQGHGQKGAGKLMDAGKMLSGYTLAKGIGKQTGITAALKDTFGKDIAGVDTNCDLLDLSMIDMPGFFPKDKKIGKKRGKEYSEKSGWGKAGAVFISPLTNDYFSAGKKLGKGIDFLSNASGFQSKTPKQVYEELKRYKPNKSSEEKILEIQDLMKNLPQGNCVCRNYVPTGIFQIDWKYYRLCFLNFKQVIRVAQEKGVDPEYIEKRLRRLFMDDFYNNFSGPFLPYREKLLKFDLNYRKLCKLKLRFGLSADKILLTRAKELKTKLQSYDAPFKDLAKAVEALENEDKREISQGGEIVDKKVTLDK